MRQQPDLAVLALEGLDGGLAVDQRGHDLAVLGGLLLADHDVVAVADRRVDHRVAGDLEQEQGAVADQLLGSGKTSSTRSSARIGPPAAIRPTIGT